MLTGEQKLTPSQKSALNALASRSGEGAIDKNGVVTCSGERLAFDSITWLRLFTMGLIQAAGVNRIGISAAGRKALGTSRDAGGLDVAENTYRIEARTGSDA